MRHYANTQFTLRKIQSPMHSREWLKLKGKLMAWPIFWLRQIIIRALLGAKKAICLFIPGQQA